MSQDRDPWLRGHKAYGEATAVVLLNGYDVPPSTCLLCLRPWIMTAVGPGQKKTSFCRVRFLQRLITSQSAGDK